MDINEVSKASGLPASTLRYYEEKGLIRSIGRNGLRRVFAESVLQRLSLIALGMLIVSAIPLKAELDDLGMLRFTIALGGAVLVPYLVSRFVYRDRAIRFPWRGGGRWLSNI